LAQENRVEVLFEPSDYERLAEVARREGRPVGGVAARNLLEQYPSLQARDAIHAAVVFANRLEGIISADGSLGLIRGLVRFDPTEIAE
jgi:hypothetical protein